MMKQNTKKKTSKTKKAPKGAIFIGNSAGLYPFAKCAICEYNHISNMFGLVLCGCPCHYHLVGKEFIHFNIVSNNYSNKDNEGYAAIGVIPDYVHSTKS